MIYITGDTHADFRRFTKKQRNRLPFELTENDMVIILIGCRGYHFKFSGWQGITRTMT